MHAASTRMSSYTAVLTHLLPSPSNICRCSPIMSYYLIVLLSHCPLMCILCLNDVPLQTFVGDVDVWSTSQQVTGRYSHKEGVFMCVCMVIQYAVILWCTSKLDTN